MIDAIIAFSLRQRVLIGMLTLLLAAAGIWAFARLPIDAVPDVTNNQVQVLTGAPALSSLEVERFVTFPIEIVLKSLPNVVELRSLSRPGLSVVTVVFEEGVDLYFARGQILEKLREVEEEMPPGAERPELAPVSTGLGEVFRYVIRDTTGKLSPMDLRTVQDWIVRRGLLGTPGIAEVNSLGGFVRQYHVLVDPDALVAYDLTLRDVLDAVARGSGNAGAGYIESGPEQYSVRSVGLATGIADLQGTVVRAGRNGTPVTLADVAKVEPGAALRFGSASQDGKGEVVTGITMQLKGANARLTVNAVKERIEEIRPSLPAGVVIEPYYDREDLVDRTIATVIRNLVEGALLVIAVLLLFLVNLRAGIVLASVIPLSMMFAGILMVLTGQSGNLMSLGAIDFGLVVDGSLIIVENCLRLLEKRYQGSGGPPLDDAGMRSLIYAGSVEVRKAAQYGELIIIVVYLPILTLQGIEGKLFRPMALTIAYALLGALLLSITYVPMMLSVVLKRKGRIRHSPIITLLQRWYTPVLGRLLRMRWAIAGTTLAMLVAAFVVFERLGGEFIPRLDEGDLALSLIRLPSISLPESQKLATCVEAVLMSFPEVRTVVSHTGRAEVSTDPMGTEIADVYVMLKPHEEWGGGRTKEELIAAMSDTLATIPGIGVQFLQPIEMRFNELIAGAKGDVAVKVVGEDFALLGPMARRVASILRATRGGEDISMEQTSGLPQLVVRPDRAAMARYGLTVEDVNTTVETAVGGARAGSVAEGEKRFDVVVRYQGAARGSIDAIRNIMVTAPSGARVPLSSVARIALEDAPVQISREDGSRFVMVQANVRGRDVESFVEEASARIAAEVKLPAGYSIVYGGQFRNLRAASDRLMIVVPVALALIFLLLFQTFRSVRIGAMIFLCVPMSIIGGVAALAIGGLPFSISAGVGFIALFGIAVLNGIVMVAAIRKHQADGMARRDAVLAGATERLRPVVTTAALAGFGFLPMLLARGAGAEVQRPLATVIVGGLISSTLLTLAVLPVIYDWLGGEHGGAGGDGGSAGRIVTAVALLLIAPHLLPSPVAAQTLTRGAFRELVIASSPEIRGGEATIAGRRGARDAATVLPPIELFGGVDAAPSPALTGRSDARLGIAQTFPFPGTGAARERAGDLLVAVAEAERDEALRAIRRRADLAWVDLAVSRWAASVADSAVAVADTFAHLAARRHELGETPALEALQASIALAGTERRRAELDLRREAAVAEALSLVGSAGGDPRSVSDTILYLPISSTLVELEDRMLATSPAIRAARLRVEAARAGQRIVAREKLPDITVEYSAQTVAGVGGFYGGSLRFALPLWRWMGDGADVAARGEADAREAERSETERSLVARLRAAYAQHAAAGRLIESYRGGLLPRSAEAYRIARRLFDEGEATYLEVLAAQTALLETRAGYVEAVWSAGRLRVEIESLLGEEVR
jgi:cobalt-zinc-cadmium resistance protein CzcA